VREERYSIDQWRDDAPSGRLVETFACGTAAVVTPVGRVAGRAHDFTIGSGGPGQLTGKLKALVDIQRGATEDRHGWVLAGLSAGDGGVPAWQGFFGTGGAAHFRGGAVPFGHFPE
jgi:hypothetical protein